MMMTSILGLLAVRSGHARLSLRIKQLTSAVPTKAARRNAITLNSNLHSRVLFYKVIFMTKNQS